MKDEQMMDDMVDNVGIMQGFMDILAEDEAEDENMDETSAVMGRTPDSPEILMNNLRGDMRSVDARRDELANIVGDSAAQETPDAVLALLQPVLAQGGIGALPQMAPMAAGPQPPMMPPGMPPLPPGAPAEMMPPPPQEGGIAGLPVGGPPPMPPPIQMRAGGLVQRFSNGSDEDGVTPAEETSYLSGIDVPEQLRQQARSELVKLATSKPTAIPDLKQLATEKSNYLTELLGRDRGLTDAQLLFSLGQRAFNYAANVDDQGRPLRGGALARLAGATRTLPSEIGKYMSDINKEERQIKLLGYEAAEKDIAARRAENLKLIESQRKAFSDLVKGGGASGLFGKGDWEWNVINKPGLIANWSVGKTSAEQDNLIDSAITSLEQPRVETRTDPVTKEPYSVTITPKLPSFLTDAIAARRQFKTGAPAVTPGVTPDAGAPTSARGPVVSAPVTPPTDLGSGVKTTPEAGEAPTRSIWSMSSDITGPANVIAGAIARTPGLGGTFPDVTQAQNLANQEVENLIEAFIKNDRAAVSEQDRLRKLYQVNARFWDDPAALRDRLVAIDEELLREIKLAEEQAYNKELPPDTRGKARNFLSSAQKFRSNLGVPIRVYSKEEAERLPTGTEILWQGKYPMRKGK